MAFCTNCGSSLAGGARFCTGCGKAIAIPPDNPLATPPAPQYQTPPQAPPFQAPPQAPPFQAPQYQTPPPQFQTPPAAPQYQTPTPPYQAPPVPQYQTPPPYNAPPPPYEPPSPPYEPPPPQYNPPPAGPSLDYTIQGDNLQIIRIKLKPGQELYAEAGKMVYKQQQVVWETRMSGDTIGEKIWGAFKRKLMGESLFLTFFHTPINGEIGFAGSYPGKIQCFELRTNQSVLVQRDSFLVAESSTQLNIAFVKKLGAGFFGGEGFVLEKLTGPGHVFIHAGGDFCEFNLQPGEVLQVETGCIVAFDEGVGYDIQFVGGIKTAIFGGEGLFLATLTGPGRVIIQSMTLAKMRRELAPAQHGGDEHKGLGAISGIFDNED